MKKSINAQNKIEPANLPKTMVSHVLVLFRKNTPLVQ
jgi:impB/mucB/samB family protein